MSKDLELIKQLEKKYGWNLKKINIEEIFLFSVPNGYAVDENENIIGLKLINLKISDISEIVGLTALKRLNLAFNQISDISAVRGLTALTHLYLSRNQIPDISALKDLKNLKELNISSNRISQLPEELLDLGLEIKLSFDRNPGIFLEDNPLETPPLEIVKKGIKAVKAYFESLKKEKTFPLNEVKVLIVGDGGTGKTSLVKRLLEREFDKNEPQTHGINIDIWGITGREKEIKVHLWDFGGQEIMHATHQFFFSKRSLYILVLDGRKEEDAEYWLKHIESFGGESPILVIINKIDQNPGFEVNRKFLMEKYPGIKGFYRISCCTGAGIDTFRQALNSHLNQIEFLKTIWAKSWFDVKSYFESMREDFISYEKYIEICEKHNIMDEKSQQTLADFLNDLGIVLHFSDPALKETNVINPEWATGAVYDIINSQTLADNKGILYKSELNKILNRHRYPMRKHDFIIELMKKFELCFLLKKDTILVPDLLAVEEPEFEFDYQKAFKFLVQYDFLPKSVVVRFIVRMHKEIKEELRWRTGVLLEDPLFGCITVVKVDNKDKKLMVFVSGSQAREYFPIIRKTLQDINSSFEKIDAREMVPCNCRECISIKEPYFYEYSFLIKALKKGLKDVLCQKSLENVSIDSLLTGIELERHDADYQWDVFISYSSNDATIIEEILADFNRHGISYWWDKEQIQPGDIITRSIEEGLENSRFVMPCFSRNQLESGWCRAEYEAILNRILSGTSEQKIIPLILDELSSDKLPLLISNIKWVRYSDKEGYREILKRLKK
ncbi:MAG: TIR domain-containing protein [Candidatus Aminicenantes bacterium]|nr:TIR domain-containing protein [Candidatus Aminicenantes bacterium]NIM82232.1 TIR domain-containing protein [Candidatus Aminicenantes bacterium]NIN20645.1 TIR domain-containing protein [Candidatus Aminicenantes bacterium]NIN44424.1 TIR domain-containing protein [Candidatus Aminicenantes bacterium]NIN87243.1 TIR domain-containing protein [Candidatus Aminicenantes bacterium]